MMYSFTFASGSSFSGKFSAPVQPVPFGSTTQTGPLTGNSGGTGVFDQASGSLQGNFTITNLSPTVPALNYTIMGSGTRCTASRHRGRSG